MAPVAAAPRARRSRVINVCQGILGEPPALFKALAVCCPPRPHRLVLQVLHFVTVKVFSCELGEGVQRGTAWDLRNQGAQRGPSWDLRNQGAQRGPVWDLRNQGAQRGPVWDLRNQGAQRGPVWDLRNQGAQRGPSWDLRNQGAQRGPSWDLRNQGAQRGPVWDLRNQGAQRGPAWDLRNQGGLQSILNRNSSDADCIREVHIWLQQQKAQRSSHRIRMQSAGTNQCSCPDVHSWSWDSTSSVLLVPVLPPRLR
ncbi:unnamed protein product [Arctogadus glacialis]